MLNNKGQQFSSEKLHPEAKKTDISIHNCGVKVAIYSSSLHNWIRGLLSFSKQKQFRFQ